MFEGLLPRDVITQHGDPAEPAECLLPDEARIIAGAAEKRRKEFARGRACARLALSQLGVEGFALLSGAEREPLWPEGVVGSVTHTEGLCAVAVAVASRYPSLGIDVERALPLPEKLVERVCRPEEREQLSSLSGLDPLTAARLLFSAKEAAYKCQFAITRRYLGFQDLGVLLDREGGLHVRWLLDSPAWPATYLFRGSWQQRGEYLLTAVWLEKSRA